VEGIGVGMWACGHVRQLPVQSGLGTAEEAKEKQTITQQRVGINPPD
jgi:hypothetical protein